MGNIISENARGDVDAPTGVTNGNVDVDDDNVSDPVISKKEVDQVQDDQDEAHPCVFNEDVLDLVFKLIITQSEVMQKDIRNARLVCKPWRNSATRLYRQTRPVKIFVQPKYSHDLYLTMQRGFLCKGSPTLSNFMSTMETSDMIPIQWYKLDGSVFANSEPKVIEDFFRIYGPEVVSLDMFIEPKVAGRIMKNLKRLSPLWKMSKLKTLSFQTYDEEQDMIDGLLGIVDLILFLFSAGRSLRELELSYLPSEQGINLQEHRDLLIVRRIPKTVKILKLYMELREPTFNKLAESGLKLEGFELRVPSELESGTLYKFLQSQAATLKSLRMWSPRGAQTGIAVKFPHLPRLVHLELSDVIISFDNSDFSKSFPKLRYLEISRMTTENAVKSLIPSGKTTPVHSLTVLHMPNWRQTPLTPMVKIIAHAFPSLTELHVWLYNETKETLEAVFTHLSNIELLHITLAESGRRHHVDSLLSGISEADCNRIGGLHHFRNVNLVGLVQRPSLLNLTHLKKLVVNKVFTCDLSPLTDFCAHFVLLEIIDLREVQFGSGISLFRRRYGNLLRDKFGPRLRVE